MKKMEACYSFDDILLLPAYSNVLPCDADTKTYLTNNIELNIPLISSAMDTVTESDFAIAIAQHGGVGCIHKNLSIDGQVSEVRRVKKYESWIVYNPITISPDKRVSEAISLMREHNYSGIPVVDQRKLVGILTNRDVRFIEDQNMSVKVSEVMTKDKLITVREQEVDSASAMKLLHENRIEKLLVVDENFYCIGLITVKDIEKYNRYPNSCKDSKGRLRVAAAIGTGKKDGIERCEALVGEEVDVVVVDTAHGHSENVINTIREIKAMYPSTQLIGGNIATKEAAEVLIDAGVDAVKVGIGPGSICTTRIVTGVGVPQFSAIKNVAEVCRAKNVRLIADGGIKYAGDVAKAIAAGADSVMIGSLFAGTDESPGEIIMYKGRAYKGYRGMGSISAMKRGSASRYFQDKGSKLTLVPQGVEGRVPFKGPASGVIHQLIGGLQAAMGYTGNRNIEEMKKNCKFVTITASGLRESHAHDIIITQEAPNYAYQASSLSVDSE
ncbi:IMP dehydrogenase [Candidatus Wolbachia massiliensis]|uniref:Inosine-5'-monophosphate dehydrogenase n=1 Tax=Candidatus Wolbachia massiliensis TaxID=1845000 RepID=A0A7M3U1W0_9RICK|nr:IMP dehydrogenase [Candidatus Wolbachia massiliensis]QOD37850.1 IMP dehydrogenase [Candidatus Wolbachia massiliensis]QOD38395.1 IMP dehydrogenase [Candidatus Wolbachia massiliensis]